MDDNKSVLAKQLAKLRVEYLTRLSTELGELQVLAGSLRGGERDRPQLKILYQHLHKVAGSGGTFGMTALSAAAQALERRIHDWLAADLDRVDFSMCQTFTTELATLDRFIVATDTLPTLSPSSAPTRTPGNSTVVWLVEEDATLCRQLQCQLDSFNYKVRTFMHIHQAELAAQTESPDILITSVLLEVEDKNVADASVRLPALRALACPLVFIAAMDDFQSRIRAVRLGALGYFVKPVNIPRLINRIGQLVEAQLAPPQRVLIVDDDIQLAAYFKMVLQAAGMQVELLDDPESIIEVLAVFQPELVLMDVHMPRYTGPELARVIRQYDHWNSLPIVYLSAETALEQQVSAMGSGGDEFLVKPISNARLVAAVRARIKHARELADQINKDSLTGLLKHARIKEVAANEITRAQRIGEPVTLAMLDIDHFKTVNDTYGHAVGDVVISALATLLRQRLRRSDYPGRYGGEEFLVVLPGCTSVEAQRLLDDIRQRFADLQFGHEDGTFSCTLSAGHATSLLDGSEAEKQVDGVSILDAADAALYEAKHSGRNRVCKTNQLY